MKEEIFKRRVKDRDIYRVHKDYARNCICNFEGRRLRINSELMGIKEEIILLAQPAKFYNTRLPLSRRTLRRHKQYLFRKLNSYVFY